MWIICQNGHKIVHHTPIAARPLNCTCHSGHAQVHDYHRRVAVIGVEVIEATRLRRSHVVYASRYGLASPATALAHANPHGQCAWLPVGDVIEGVSRRPPYVADLANPDETVCHAPTHWSQ